MVGDFAELVSNVIENELVGQQKMISSVKNSFGTVNKFLTITEWRELKNICEFKRKEE